MIRKIDSHLSSQSPARLGVYCLILLITIGTCDFLTGYELSFSIFYLLPVSLSAWYVDKTAAAITSVLASAAWLLVEFTAGPAYTNQSFLLWNAAVRLGFFLIVATLIVRLRLLVDFQTSLAQKDGLTGVLNARTLGYVCEPIFDLAHRHGHPLTLAYMDLDGFKAINDKLGHSVGDEVLMAVAATLSTKLRSSDIVARMGGDEFCIVLPETSLAGARIFFTDLHSSLRELATDRRWPIGFSIGVAIFHSPTETLDEAIRCADSLMYQVKRSGKNDTKFAEFRSVEPS